MTNLAYHKREISVYGGDQLSSIFIYMIWPEHEFLIADKNLVCRTFNAGYENQTVNHLALLVKKLSEMILKLKYSFK